MQYGFYFDATRCIGCNACAVACKDWNDIQPGQKVQWRRVTTFEYGKAQDVGLFNISLSCMHCAKPACQSVCPTGAITKRAEDGIVVVDQTKCIGCHQCFQACPFGVPQYGADGKMQKCDLCPDRLAAGKDPACVATCPTLALHWGTMEELSILAAEKSAKKLQGTTTPSVIISK